MMDSSLSDTPCEVREGFILLGRKGVYKVEKFLGEGSYGKVAKCKKLGTDQVVAIKIIWGSGQMEINALEELSQINADDHNLVKFVESFKYKKYTCIAFEVLDQSLLDFMEKRDFHPLTVEEIRTIAWQLIVALKGLKSVNLVHCDIKLDNIMLVDQVSEPFRVKLIDFGLAEKIGHMRTGAMMQNICYRAPEVILGLPLDQSVDLWTVGYILFVLYTGSFIHGWDAEYNILRAMVKMQGMPEEKVLSQGVYTTRFFTKTKENSQDVWKLDTPQQQSKKKGRLVEDNIPFWSCDQLIHSCLDKTKIKEVQQFVDLLKRMLMVDPSKRISPSEALQHPFFTMGRVQPTAGSHTTNPEEPPALEVHPQPEAKEVTNTPQRPAAVSQEFSSMKKKPGRIQQQRETIREHLAKLEERCSSKKKPGRIQQQRETIREHLAKLEERCSFKKKPGRIQQQRDAINNYQAALQKRNPGTQQDHNTDKSLQSQAAFRRKRHF
ncbi:homeodomain-interacting protein kinase 2-like [Oryzias latipes]|uniref:homeodomain-interacting protein kinase 2-like n=1 Tax=Oryzias latipes TaxID=8090 RepID=UPI000CE18710|nr:homeodomain-interacting protein kinase 2-like [Oryzias latipes]